MNPLTGPQFQPTQDLARELVLRYGYNAVAYQLLNPGFEYWFSAAGDAVAGYVTRGGFRIVAGAPVCALEKLADVLAEFEEDAAASGLKACYFGAALRLYESSLHKPPNSAVLLGAQPVWDPARWADIIATKPSLRAQLNRARNKGVQVRQAGSQGIGPLGHELRQLLHAWLAAKPMPPMHFLVEPDTLGLLTDRRLFVAQVEDQLLGYLIASPIPARKGWLIEQIIRHPGAPNGTNELLLHSAMQELARDNVCYVTLGLVPLSAHATQHFPPNPLWVRVLFRWVRAHGRRFYDFHGLEAFKSKFRPDSWEPIFAVCNTPYFTPAALYAIAAAFSHGSSPWLQLTGALSKAARQEVRWLNQR